MTGQKIKQRREQLGYTQQYLAELCNTTQSLVSCWENGKKEPYLCNLKVIAKALEVDLNYFNN